MNVTLYMAISIDGFIAKIDGDSDWVSSADSKIFEQKIAEAGCIVVGRLTFEQFYNDLYPVKGVTNIVVTSDSSKKDDHDNVVFVDSAKKAVEVAQSKGHENTLLIGGGHINGAFLAVGLVNEIFLSVHPLVLGSGIKVFEDFIGQVNIELLGVKQLDEGLVQLHYKLR